MGNSAIVALVLDRFEMQLQNDIAAIEQHLRASDAVQVARTAHALKGAAGAVAATALLDVVAQIEALARQDQLDAIVPQLASFRIEVQRCLSHLPTARAALADAKSSRLGTESAP